MGIFSELLGAGLGIGQSLIEGSQSRKNINLQNQRNMELSKYQYDQQKAMWNEANAYNSPLAQMERYKQAGLNPNLIYGQGSPGNSPNTLPQYQAPTYHANYKAPVDISQAAKDAIDMKRGMNDMAIQQQQLLNLIEDGKIKKQEAKKREAFEDFYNDLATNFYLKSGYGLGPAQLQDLLAKSSIAMMFDYTPTGTKFGGRVETGKHLPADNNVLAKYMLNKYEQPYEIGSSQLRKYNAEIELAKANLELKNLDIANYLPPWIRTAGGLIGNIGGLAKGLLRKRGSKGTTTKNKSWKSGNKTGSSTELIESINQ